MNTYTYVKKKEGITIFSNDSYLKPVCNGNEENAQEVMDAIKERIPSDSLLKNLSVLYKMFSDETRLKIIFALYNGELCVKHLCEVTGMEQSAISHQLRTLKKEKLVKSIRDGKNMYYSLDDEHIADILSIGYRHVRESK